MKFPTLKKWKKKDKQNKRTRQERTKTKAKFNNVKIGKQLVYN